MYKVHNDVHGEYTRQKVTHFHVDKAGTEFLGIATLKHNVRKHRHHETAEYHEKCVQVVECSEAAERFAYVEVAPMQIGYTLGNF